MYKPFAKLLTFWIPGKSRRHKARSKLVNYSPVKDYLHGFYVKKYLEKKSKRGKARVVIYSAVAGNFDKLRNHQYLIDDFDYVLYTDEMVDGLYAWEIRPMKEYYHKLPVRRAKYYKMFPDKLFPEYEYSVWIDGKWEITGNDIETRVKQLIEMNAAIACMPHPRRNCIYKEAEICKELNLDNHPLIDRQMAFFHEQGYPEENGLYEMSIMFRKHHALEVKKLMLDWWSIVEDYSSRDQLSFSYCLWKNNFVVADLFTQKDSPAAGNNAEYRFWSHNV